MLKKMVKQLNTVKTMKNFKRLLVPMVLIAIMLVVSCKKDERPAPIKVGLVTGFGNINDRGFNQQAYEGLLAAAGEVNLEWEVKEISSVSDIENNIAYFAGKNFDVIITLTYDAAQPTLDAAYLYPEIKFLLLDYSFASLPANMACITYEVDQASFPCGFLAASWAQKVNPSAAKVGYVAGPDTPPIQQFTKSFRAGVEYFKQRYGLNVSVLGANANSFNDTIQGAHLADSLMQLGAEVIFACAGKSGNGALYQAKNAGKVAIGVDVDQYLTIPEVGNILLTSCMKKMGDGIIQEIVSISKGEFHGGQTIISNLENNGVDLAPYHDFQNLIPDSTKTAILEIKQGIISGTIATGWK